MTKELGKATIDGMVIRHSSTGDGGCEINVYSVKSVKSKEDGLFGNGDSVWGYDPGCNCDITSETSPTGQEKYLEQKCHQLTQIKGQAGTTTADYSITSETTIVDNHQPSEVYQAGMGGSIIAAGLTIALVTGMLYKTLTLNPGSGKNKDKK